MYTPTTPPPPPPPPSSLSDLHCTCLHLSALPSSPCVSLPHIPLTWPAAYSLATEHNIPLHFATHTTIERILKMPSPLPTSVLQVAGRGPAVVALEGGRDEIVCGFGGRGEGSRSEEGADQGGFVSQVVAWLMVLIAVYMLGEWVVAKLRERGLGRRIALGGGEKRLRV
jgi:hypothetical protein